MSNANYITLGPLSQPQVDLIITGLLELPGKTTYGLITAIRDSANAQITAAAQAPVVEADPVTEVPKATRRIIRKK